MIPPVARSFRLRAVYAIPTLRTGLFTGGLLIVVMLASLFAATRVPGFEPFAGIRNDICRALFGLVMLIPIFRFLTLSRRMFASALIGWTIFAMGYDFAGMYFSNLFTALGHTPLELFVLGAIFYGVVAAVSWVAWMVLAAAHDPVVPAPRNIHTPHHHR
ncbi:MAG TPA: hypothetical protein VMV59_02795 [Candidatus Dormibacteraeota bacterium]|nr:hypothetical protein [Candidatus Dormibacteraeota bacterium]